MRFITPLIAFFILASQVAGFSSWNMWHINSWRYNPTLKYFNPDTGDPTIATMGDVATNLVAGCYSTSFNKATGWLESDFNDRLVDASVAEFSVAFLVSFESTISDKVFQFGKDDGPHYIVSSSQNGKLDVAYYKDLTTPADSNSNFSINVPLSNFYTDKYFFIIFYFGDSSPSAHLKIGISNSGTIDKTSAGGSTSPFQMPYGKIQFFKSIVGRIHSVYVVKTFDLTNIKHVTLIDAGDNSYIWTWDCSGDCADDICDENSYCYSSYDYCQCGASDCSACSDNSGRDSNRFCQACKTGFTFKNHHCCDNTNNCAGCSKTSNNCDLCATGEFLYQNPTKTVCISCDKSCTDCNPGPDCFECASLVVQDGNTCRVDKVGFQISYENSNIVIDFAYPLTVGLTKDSFKATSVGLKDIATTGWTFTGCTAGSKQCIIGTSNILDSDMPVDLDIQFATV